MIVQELRGMTPEDLNQQLRETYQELFNLRFRLSTKQLRDTSQVSKVKRDLARIKTVLRERELIG